jgi:23S rRNA G2445 N2-methylase RlmL
VGFSGTMADAWRANLELRTAVRVLRRLARFQARDADALYAGIAALDWSRLIAPEGTLWIDARTRESALDHSQFIAQRAKDAIVDGFRERAGTRPSVDRERPDLRLNVHLYRDRATVSIDTSGDSLHKRGWRRSQGRAPLAETLAAGIVLLSGWDRRAPLLDPFAGSATILIEAGMMAAGIAPGLFREQFGFERLPGHDAAAYARLKAELERRRSVPRKLRLIGSDSMAERIDEARENAAAVGLEELIELEVADARDFEPRRGWNAWIVTNPPYGERLSDAERLVPLYRDFGARLRAGCSGYTLALLTANPVLVEALAVPDLETLPLLNGGIECRLLQGLLR